jgi:hypothetical protein
MFFLLSSSFSKYYYSYFPETAAAQIDIANSLCFCLSLLTTRYVINGHFHSFLGTLEIAFFEKDMRKRIPTVSIRGV